MCPIRFGLVFRGGHIELEQLSGLYLFVLPYATKWVAGDAPTERAAGPSLRVLCERVGLGGVRKTGLLRESGMPTLQKAQRMGHSRYRR